LQFTQLPPGWMVEPRPERVPPLEPYRVTRHGVRATIDPSRVADASAARSGEVVVSFTHGFTRRQTDVPMVVPVALIQRREGGLSMNGSLDDWGPDDSIQKGPLVRMLDRPMIQTHKLVRAATSTDLYATWSSEQIYFAFKVGGMDTSPVRSAQNFVQYDFRRAWGEDVAQVIVQAVFADGSVSLPIHVAFKPNGGIWAERKVAENMWDAFDSGVRYATSNDSVAGQSAWRGEFAIPFRSLQSATTSGSNVPAVPVMLRFNFAQHQHINGVSATWAGPVDHGRDDAFTGALVLVETK